MLQRLKLPANLDGMAWRYANPAGANRRHRHAELELNLVTRGTGTYLLGNRHYQIRRGDLLWLFPAQEHVLIEQTPDFEMWIAVFRRRLIKRSATDPASLPLQQRSFSGDTCRRLRQQDLSRFEELFAQLADTADEPGLLNAGLAYAFCTRGSVSIVPARFPYAVCIRRSSGPHVCCSPMKTRTTSRNSHAVPVSVLHVSVASSNNKPASPSSSSATASACSASSTATSVNATPAGKARCSMPPLMQDSAAIRSFIASFDRSPAARPRSTGGGRAINPQEPVARASRSPLAEPSRPPSCSGRSRAHSRRPPDQAPGR